MHLDGETSSVRPALTLVSHRPLSRHTGRRRLRAGGTARAVQRPIKVLIVSGDPTERERWTAALSSEDGVTIVGEASDAYDALVKVRQRPHVLLLDATLLSECGSVLVATLRRASRRTRILVLTRDTTSPLLLDALCRGAQGYIDTTESGTVLFKAVTALHAGEAWIPRSRVSDLVACLVQLAPKPRRRPSFKQE
jgi:DNA-binding NarL/FixJ family response regulator